MEKTIKIGDKDVTLRATAATPYLYREAFGRDMFVDMAEAQNGGNTALFTRAAYIMAKQADAKTANTIVEWLDQFSMFDVMQAVPQIMDVWGLNEETTVKSKKKAD